MYLDLANDTLDLCMRMGVALSVWQSVEDQHYHLFLTLIGDKTGTDVSAVTYFSVESFDARRVLISRMVQSFPTTKDLRIEWNALDKLLKDNGENRNKVAHYGIYHSIYEAAEPDEKGHKAIKVAPPSLQPSAYNKVSELLGRTSDKPDHNISAAQLNSYIIDFGKLAMRVAQFGVACGRIQWRDEEVRKPPPPMAMIAPPPPLNTLRSRPAANGG